MGFFSRLFGLESVDAPETTPHAAPEGDSAIDVALARTVLSELDIDRAIDAHAAWKAQLEDVLAGTSNERLDLQVVCRDDRCELGTWLHGTGRQHLGHYPAFDVLVARHKYFHAQAGAVLSFAQSGQQEHAFQTLNGSYRYASSQVILLLKELKRGLVIASR